MGKIYLTHNVLSIPSDQENPCLESAIHTSTATVKLSLQESKRAHQGIHNGRKDKLLKNLTKLKGGERILIHSPGCSTAKGTAVLTGGVKRHQFYKSPEGQKWITTKSNGLKPSVHFLHLQKELQYVLEMRCFNLLAVLQRSLDNAECFHNKCWPEQVYSRVLLYH